MRFWGFFASFFASRAGGFLLWVVMIVCVGLLGGGMFVPHVARSMLKDSLHE